MAINLKIELAGDEQLNRTLGLILEGVNDLRPAFVDMSKELNSYHKAVFANEGQHGGNQKWAPLKEKTLQRKKNKKILNETGTLRGSFTSDSADGAIRVIKKLLFQWGSSTPYAGYHQTGTRNMPKRSPLRFNDRLRRRMVKIVQKYYFDFLKASANGNLGKLSSLKAKSRTGL